MDLFTHKLAVLAMLVCVRLSVGLSPLFLCRTYHEKRLQLVDLFIALCLSLSGGILLATCFIHLVPQVRIAMHYFLPEHTLPVTELLLVAGFFITFFIDEAVLSFRQSSANSKVYPDGGGPDSPPLSPPPPAPRSQVWLPAVLLGLHSLAKGAAVGLAESLPDLWLLCIAAAAHESVAMFGFTLILLQLGRGTKTIVVLSLVVALFMVVGMVVGTIVAARGVDAVVTAVVRGLAAGNILYVTFYELLTKEVRTRAMGLLSHLLALLGFLLMLGIQLLGGQESTYSQRAPSCTQEPSPEPDYEGSYEEENP